MARHQVHATHARVGNDVHLNLLPALARLPLLSHVRSELGVERQQRLNEIAEVG